MAANFEITCSRAFPDWLAEQEISLGVTTYQGNRLLLLELKPDERLSVFQRIFQRRMWLQVVEPTAGEQREGEAPPVIDGRGCARRRLCG